MTDAPTHTFYEQHAASYGNVAPHGAFVDMRSAFISQLHKHSRVLDLGCGGGHAMAAFKQAGFSVQGFDGSPALAAIAAARTGMDVRCADFMELDYCSEFDGIWAAASLTHLPAAALPAVMDRVIKALKDNGLLCASFKAAASDWRDDHGRLYGAVSAQQLRDHCARLNCQVQAMHQRTGLTNQTTTWLWLFARKLP